jgi:hypothetical protein
MKCPKCETELKSTVFISMGPGYNEFESHQDGETVMTCPICRENTDVEWHIWKETPFRCDDCQRNHDYCTDCLSMRLYLSPDLPDWREER